MVEKDAVQLLQSMRPDHESAVKVYENLKRFVVRSLP